VFDMPNKRITINTPRSLPMVIQETAHLLEDLAELEQLISAWEEILRRYGIEDESEKLLKTLVRLSRQRP
jgi:hypothetical protein